MRFLLVIILTNILSRTVLKLSQVIVQILDEKRTFCVLALFGGLGATYSVHLRLIRKLVVDVILIVD